MTPPTTPPDENARQWMSFALYFKTRRGFMETYARNLDRIWPSKRRKRGLKTIAYEATETLYQDIVREGRKYPDVENFRDAWNDHCKNPTSKRSDKP